MRIIERKRNLLSRLVLAQDQILVFDMLLAQLPFEPFSIFHQTQLGRAQLLLLVSLHHNPIDEPVQRDACFHLQCVFLLRPIDVRSQRESSLNPHASFVPLPRRTTCRIVVFTG